MSNYRLEEIKEKHVQQLNKKFRLFDRPKKKKKSVEGTVMLPEYYLFGNFMFKIH